MMTSLPNRLLIKPLISHLLWPVENHIIQNQVKWWFHANASMHSTCIFEKFLQVCSVKALIHIYIIVYLFVCLLQSLWMWVRWLVNWNQFIQWFIPLINLYSASQESYLEIFPTNHGDVRQIWALVFGFNVMFSENWHQVNCWFLVTVYIYVTCIPAHLFLCFRVSVCMCVLVLKF